MSGFASCYQTLKWLVKLRILTSVREFLAQPETVDKEEKEEDFHILTDTKKEIKNQSVHQLVIHSRIKSELTWKIHYIW